MTFIKKIFTLMIIALLVSATSAVQADELAQSANSSTNEVSANSELSNPSSSTNENTSGDQLGSPSSSTNENTTPAPAPITGGGAGSAGVTFGSSASGGLTSGTPVSGTASSTIASTTAGIDMNCAKLFKTHMKFGSKNDKAEVARLQAFLNKNLGTNIKTTGFFGTATLSAVKLFQLKYTDSVLKPWVDAKLSTDLTTKPSGYVYLTTQRQINLLECPAHDIPMPILK